MKQSSKYVAAHMAESRKRNNRMSILTYIIFALVATIIFSGSTLSRYTHLVQGFDEADVIVTTIYLTEDMYADGATELVQSIDLEGMTPGMTLTKYIKIRSATPNANGEPTNVSTSPQYYSMEISSLGVLPLTFTLTPHSMAQGSNAGFINDGSTVTVNEALIPAGDNSNIYKLEIHWPESANENEYSGTTDRITIRVNHENIYGSDVVVGATVSSVDGPIAAGEEVKFDVIFSEYANGYAGISLNDIVYDSNLLEFVGFEETNEFQGAMFVYGDELASMIAIPFSAEDAANVSGGKFTTLVFRAKTDISTSTGVSVGFEDIIIYTEGEADGWVDTALIAINTETGGVVVN